MLRAYVASFRAKQRQPGLVFLFLASVWNLLAGIRKVHPILTQRFLQANNVPLRKLFNSDGVEPSVEILFVTAGKDIDMLTYSIPAARSSVLSKNINLPVVVLVPETEINRTRALTSRFEEVYVYSEDFYVSSDIKIQLRNKFGDRFGWALQQILKVSYVLKSSHSGVLIVDADTVLIDEKLWLNSHSEQILMPTDEYNVSYYDFLNSFKLSDVNPKYTFVSHHMLMQPKYLREAYSYAGWETLEILVSNLCAYEFLNSNSPFCIEYEAYAQYMIKFHSEKVILTKWANKGIPRELDLSRQIPSAEDKCRKSFNSLSFHTYL
jgi:hypothetical protein